MGPNPIVRTKEKRMNVDVFLVKWALTNCPICGGSIGVDGWVRIGDTKNAVRYLPRTDIWEEEEIELWCSKGNYQIAIKCIDHTCCTNNAFILATEDEWLNFRAHKEIPERLISIHEDINNFYALLKDVDLFKNWLHEMVWKVWREAGEVYERPCL